MKKIKSSIFLKESLKNLKLPAMARTLKECSRQAKENNEGYEEFLMNLVQNEVEQRRVNKLKRLLKQAKFPYFKPLENTIIDEWSEISPMKIKELSECRYIDKKENIILLGKHGTGKTHGAIMFGIEACRAGYRTYFTSAAALVNNLVEARDEKQLKRLMKKLSKYHLLIIDELGYIPITGEGGQLLFQVVADRYELGSMIITTNLSFTEWTKVFVDVNLTAALLDRLTHHCHVLQFDWDSLRLKESLKNKNRKSKNR